MLRILRTSLRRNLLRKPVASLIAAVVGHLAWSSSGLQAAPISFCLDFSERPKPANFKKYDFSIHGESSRANITAAQLAGKKFYGYISVGQVRANAWYLDKVERRGINFFGKNERWNSYLVDLSDPRWGEFVVDTLAKGVVNKGYDGFFLDTLDTVENLMRRDEARARDYYKGLVNLVKRLKAAYPEKRIITNRGFAVFDGLKTTIDGMLVEELFQKDDYSARSSQEVQELLDRIAPVSEAGLPIYIVDYVPRGDKELADRTARKIQKLGFHPCIIPQEIDGTVLAPEPQPPPPAKPKPVEAGYQLVLSPGFNLVANQLDRGGNTLGEIFPDPPEGTTCYAWDNQSGVYLMNTFMAGAWSDPKQVLKPGGGVFLFNPVTSNVILALNGKIPESSAQTRKGGGLAVVACRTPIVARFEDVFGFAPIEGDRVFRFRAGSYESYSYWGPGWGREPVFDVGEAFFVDLSPEVMSGSD